MKRCLDLGSLFTADESGQDMIEYALVLAMVSLLAVASLKALSATFTKVLTSSVNALASSF